MREFKGFQKGVNLGGWISQFDKYDKNHFDTFITEEDIKKIKTMGFDHVRVPVDYNVLEDEEGNIIPDGFSYLSNCLKWCENSDLNMLIDLHECFGYSFDPLKKDMDRKKFFFDSALQERFLKLWREIATRFKDNTDRVAFEPINEVVLPEVKDAWNELAGRYIKMMREIVPDAYIVIGGVCYNSVTSVPLLNVPTDEKIVYNFHCYEPLIFTHQSAYWVENMPLDFHIGYPKTLEEYREASGILDRNLVGAIFEDGVREIGPGFFEGFFEPAIEKAKNDDVALYCGEYGAIDRAADDDRVRWMTDIHNAFKKYNIGHALWNYKEKDYGLTETLFDRVKETL